MGSERYWLCYRLCRDRRRCLVLGHMRRCLRLCRIVSKVGHGEVSGRYEELGNSLESKIGHRLSFLLGGWSLQDLLDLSKELAGSFYLALVALVEQRA